MYFIIFYIETLLLFRKKLLSCTDKIYIVYTHKIYKLRFPVYICLNIQRYTTFTSYYYLQMTFIFCSPTGHDIYHNSPRQHHYNWPRRYKWGSVGIIHEFMYILFPPLRQLEQNTFS